MPAVADDYPLTPRTSLRRLPARASYDRDVVHAILDEGLVAHLGMSTEIGPRVIPTTYGRIEDTVYVHGSVANHAFRTAATGIEVCLVVTLLDGLVMARSAFHHSMNYRSVVVYGTATTVTDPSEKRAALDVIVNKSVPGRADEARPPTELELRSTLVLALPLVEVSAKIRTGGPIDDEADLDWPVWAGVIPLHLQAGEPIAG